MTVICGIDYSLTSPGICVLDGDKIYLYFMDKRKKIPMLPENIVRFDYPEIWKTDQERYQMISNVALSVIEKHKVDVVWIEGYAYAAGGSAVFPICENVSVLKYRLWQHNIPFNVVPPTSVKKFATEKGNSNKEAMYEAFVKATGIELTKLLELKSEKIGSPVSDMADAYWIARYGKSKSKE